MVKALVPFGDGVEEMEAVIVIDTLRSDRLDVYGYDKVTAPFIT